MALDDLKPLIEEGNKVISAIRAEVEGIKTADVVTEQKLAKMEADLAATFAAKQAAELATKALENRLAEIETKTNRPGSTAAHQKAADEMKAAFIDYMRKGANGGAEARLFDLQQKAADVRTSTGASGGFALPKEIADQVLKMILDISPIRSISRVVQTGTTDYHQVVNRGGLSAEWVAETGTRTLATVTSDFGDVAPTFGELSAVPEATRHSINDLFFDVEAMLVADGAERFAIAEGIAFISGDGTNKPTGFLTGTPVATVDASRAFGVLQYVATGQAAALATNPWDTLKDMLYSMKAGYRQNASWVMNSILLAAHAKIRDTTGQYLLTPAVREGDPDTILGKRIVVAEDMPAVGAGNFPIALGDFSRGYLIADIPGMWMVRDEVTKVGWVRFPMAKRIGGKILDSNAIKLLKVAAS
jgi:HK97 family phage major capsid protein